MASTCGADDRLARGGPGARQHDLLPARLLRNRGWPPELLWQVVLSQWAIKTAWEALLTPVTYAAVGWLKRREGVELFDTATHFSPFARSSN